MKRYSLPVAVLLLLFAAGCSFENASTKKITVVIPPHPWENGNGIDLWYSLKWNDNGKIESMYVDTKTRKINLRIPKNCTVYICAYPLGEMLPFGTAITPENTTKEVELNQNEGFLAHLLINSELGPAEHVNYNKLVPLIEAKTYDFRCLDDAAIVADVLNGRLNKSSVEIKKKYRIEPISIPNGKWIGEFYQDGVLNVTDGKTGALELPVGVTRFYCPELDREFRIALDIDGSVFYNIRYGMIGL